MTVSLQNPDTICPPMGRYSHVAVATGTRIVSIAGQVGLRPDGTLEEGVAAQATQAYANIGHALEAAGASWADVVKVTTFVVSADLLGDLGDAREAVYARIFPGGPSTWPPSTLLVVRGLAHPDLLVEIEATAVVA
ncbi:MAG TPA: RidA family protein [Capillimicrobium sp.]|nr:RidA family protein [Capillimicrobium sp.]